MGGGCSFFWISGDTFPNRKQNCSLVMRKKRFIRNDIPHFKLPYQVMKHAPLLSLGNPLPHIHFPISFSRPFLVFAVQKAKQRAASDIFRQRKSWAAAIFVYTRLTNHRHRIPLICNNTLCCATSGNTRNRNLAIICHTTEQVRVWVYSLFDVTNFFACMFTKT